MAKIQISIADDLLERVELYCKRNYMTRSGLFSQSVLQLMNSTDAVTAMISLAACMQRIADNGDIDEQTKKELRAIQAMVDGMQILRSEQ